MQFCSKCGRLMLPKKTGDETVLVCSSCGYAAKDEGMDEYKVVKKVKQGEEITVIEEDAIPTLPTTKARCPSCEHNKAYWWLRQTRSADEPTTRFYRCVKCGKVWREYT